MVAAAASSGLVAVNSADIDEVRGAYFSSCRLREFSFSKIKLIQIFIPNHYNLIKLKFYQ
jgi:hypothetical protein